MQIPNYVYNAKLFLKARVLYFEISFKNWSNSREITIKIYLLFPKNYVDVILPSPPPSLP